MSTFQGLEMSKRALFAQQGALHTTGHNISNVNTSGYSRQRVDFQTTTPYQNPARMMPTSAGQKGTGVEIGVIERIRNKFLDMQYRSENSNMGYWDTRQDALSRMEELLNEPSENGLQKTMDRFWQSLQDMADDPQDDGPRSVVAQRGQAVAETFNHFSKELEKIQGDLKEEIYQSEDDINGLLKDINGINKQVKKIEPHGQLANDLYDERDRLLDKLSEFVNIKVEYTPSSSSSLDIADGIAEVKLLDENGQEQATLLGEEDTNKSNEDLENRVKLDPAKEDGKDYVTGIKVDDGETIAYDKMKRTGSLSALIQSFGYGDEDGVDGDYPKILEDLDKMAKSFAEAFNEQHKEGTDLNGDTGVNFFVNKDEDDSAEGITASNITVNKDILDDGSLIAASKGNSQNNDNAHKLSDVFDKEIIGDKSIRKYYNGVIGKIGVDGQEAKRNVENTEILQNQIDDSRQSTSAVSLDEEMSNMVKFQHAYNAAARNMTTVDEMIDRIINNMGLVGR